VQAGPVENHRGQQVVQVLRHESLLRHLLRGEGGQGTGPHLQPEELQPPDHLLRVGPGRHIASVAYFPAVRAASRGPVPTVWAPHVRHHVGPLAEVEVSGRGRPRCQGVRPAGQQHRHLPSSSSMAKPLRSL
jgi:hypothetical protein